MSRTAMTKDVIIPAGPEFVFPAVFHFYKQSLVAARADADRIPGLLDTLLAVCGRDS